MICNRHEFEEIYYVGVETSRTTDSYKPKDLPMNQILLSMCIVLFLCLSVQIGMPRLQDLDKKACKAFGILSLEEFCLCAYVNSVIRNQFRASLQIPICRAVTWDRIETELRGRIKPCC